MQSMNPPDGNPSSNIMMSLISSVSRRRFLIVLGFVVKISVPAFSAAYDVEHLSDMICLMRSNPIFCSNLVSMDIFLSSKSFPPYSSDSDVLKSSLSSFMFCMAVTLPPLTNEILPVSSDTTIASASVSSVIPMAALCLIPKFAGMSVFSVIGRVHRAATILSPEMTMAPSCRGEFLKNMFMIRRL